MRGIASALALMLGLVACSEQETGPAGLMEACAPIDATGESIGAALKDTGWEMETPSRGSALRDLVGSQMWSFAEGEPVEAQISGVDDLVFALKASLRDPVFGTLYARPDEVAVVLSQGENLTCLWVGGDSKTFHTRVKEVGGFPTIDTGSAVTTASRTQMVEANGRNWTRIERYAQLTEKGREGPYPMAARLDRSPVP